MRARTTLRAAYGLIAWLRNLWPLRLL